MLYIEKFFLDRFYFYSMYFGGKSGSSEIRVSVHVFCFEVKSIGYTLNNPKCLLFIFYKMVYFAVYFGEATNTSHMNTKD